MGAFEGIRATFDAFEGVETCAYRDEVAAITFAQLHRRALALAAGLVGRVTPGAKVAIFGHKSAEYIVAYWGLALAGHPIVPMETDLPAERQARIVDSLGLEIAIDARRAGDTTPFCGGCPLFAPADVAAPGGGSVQAMPQDEAIAYVLHSSGSTGAPKAICITWANVWDFVTWVDDLLPEARAVAAISGNIRYCFDVSLFEMWASWRAQRTLVSYDQGGLFSARAIARAYQRAGVGIWVSTPSIARLACFDKTFNAAALPDLRTFLFCGEVLEPDLVRMLRDRFGSDTRIVNTYGPTEATVAVTSVDITAAHLDANTPLPIGRARPGTRLKVFPLADGSGNELVICGTSVGPGYARAADDRKGAFHVPGEYRTGDLATRQSDGLWYFQGRTDREVKINGHRVDLSTLEAYLRGQPEVSDVRCVCRSSKRGGAWLEIHVLGQGGQATLVQLARRYARDFPPYFNPRHWFGYGDVLVNQNSKTDWPAMIALTKSEKETFTWTSAATSTVG